MNKIIFITFSFLTLCSLSFGQNSNCPTISVTGPMNTIQPDGEMDFTASVSGADVSKIGYRWIVSEGSIVRGQGTSKIFVNIKGLYDNAINATVEFLNLPEGCSNTISETGIVACRCVAFQIDEFGKIPYRDQKIRLNAIKNELEKNAEDAVYIILYQAYKDNNLDERTKKIKKILLNESKIPGEKLFIIFGGDEPEERTEIYIVPPGAEPPTP